MVRRLNVRAARNVWDGAGHWEVRWPNRPTVAHVSKSLFYRHRGEVRAYARRRASPAVAEDAVAETFLIAWKRLDAISDDPLPWLFGVARRVIANQHRGEHRRHALLERLRGDRGSRSWDAE